MPAGAAIESGRGDVGRAKNVDFELAVEKKLKRETPAEESFGNGNPYSTEEVRADLEQIAEYKRSPEWKPPSPVERGFEYALAAGAQQHGWLGSEVRAVHKTGEFDDVKRGVDVFVEFEDADGDPVFLGIDTTTDTRYVHNISKKVGRLLERADKLELTHLKYVQGKQVRGSVDVPLVIIGRTPESSNVLQQELADATRDPVVARAAKENPAQVEMLQQAEAQLAKVVEYALKKRGVIASSLELGPKDVRGYLIKNSFKLKQGHPRLYPFVRVHADALSSVQRALKEKAAVRPAGSATAAAEQASVLGLLSDPKRWRV